ncbi:ABC transporter substrate-binding protein [Pseudoflavitalea sp. G-6-1-2]|uniref:ABC transporter substrate-binding protein n=1 Tax=Pseudoflavitalea sp. G-6-1-2 TaxID=2728841 RepID=UPI00146C74F2|nr:ABC transporter substrate-binding protein [Pseudoflavitalea sp. G-6-1-2]NML20857.1 ABC transporter substrate-binding protein [Pseudoflavitalea sp. G-6-1-2]
MKKLFSILSLSVALYGCTDNSETKHSSNIVVTDAKGNTISLEKPAEKIVALFDPSVDAIYMLQAQDKLIGIPAETYADKELFEPYKRIDARVAAKSLTIPGSNETANLESILQLKPDLVIVQNMTPGTINSLKQMNIPVYQAAASKYEDVMKELKDIGALTGKNDRAAELLQYADSTIKSMQTQSAAITKKKNAYFAWANGRIFSTAGHGSMMHNTLTNAGVNNVCTTEIDQPNINPETLLQWNPDMIIMWNDSPDLFYNKKELSAITAIQQKQIFNLMPMFYYNPHTLKSLAASVAINQWAYGFADNGHLAKVENIIKKLYGEENGAKLLNYFK